MKRHPVLEEDFRRIASSDLPWSDLEGATVLVTGANGLIPAYLVEALLFLNENRLSKPLKILALVRNEEKARERFAGYEGRPDFTFFVQDVCEPLKIEEPVSYIIHAASQASPKYFVVDPVGTLKANTIGTYHLLEMAREKAAAKFLFISSGEVYGKLEATDKLVSEDTFGTLDPTEPRACYGESKRMGETMCSAWHRQYGVATNMARLGHTYGPRMDLEDGRVFADLVANVLKCENIVLKSNGGASRPFCYLSDAAIGLFTVLLKGVAGEAYNVMNDEGETRVRDLAAILCALFPEKGLRVIFQTESDGRPLDSHEQVLRVDTRKLRSLGWSPTISVPEGFERTIRSFTG